MEEILARKTKLGKLRTLIRQETYHPSIISGAVLGYMAPASPCTGRRGNSHYQASLVKPYSSKRQVGHPSLSATVPSFSLYKPAFNFVNLGRKKRTQNKIKQKPLQNMSTVLLLSFTLTLVGGAIWAEDPWRQSAVKWTPAAKVKPKLSTMKQLL